MIMKLYHFTQPGDVVRIASEGLKPNVRDENAHMTGGVPVVWLTRQFDNIVTAADLEHVTGGWRDSGLEMADWRPTLRRRGAAFDNREA
jgi:hypothetical protein